MRSPIEVALEKEFRGREGSEATAVRQRKHKEVLTWEAVVGQMREKEFENSLGIRDHKTRGTKAYADKGRRKRF